MSNFGLSVKCKLTEYLTYREFLFVEFFVTTVIYSAVDSTGDIWFQNLATDFSQQQFQTNLLQVSTIYTFFPLKLIFSLVQV